MKKNEQISLRSYTKAKENAENIFNRELTKEENMALMMGLEYGKLEGYIEGIQSAGQEIKDTLQKVTAKKELSADNAVVRLVGKMKRKMRTQL